MKLTESALRKIIRSVINERWNPPEALQGTDEDSATMGMMDIMRNSSTKGWEYGGDTMGGDYYYGESDDADVEVDEIDDDQDPRPDVFDLVGGFRPEELEDQHAPTLSQVHDEPSLPSSNHHERPSRRHRYQA